MQKELLFKEYCRQTYKTSFTPPPRSMCDTCGKQFHEKYVFEAHINVHSKKCYTCTYPKCDLVYKSAAKYQRHLMRHCETQEPRTCSECDKSFEEKKCLDEHMKLHSEDLPEECPHCGKRFCWCSSLGIYI